MSKKLLYGMIVIMLFSLFKAQAQSDISATSGADSTMPSCKMNAAYVHSTLITSPPSGPSAATLPPSSYPASATAVCGHFTFYFDDILIGVPYGYNDPSSAPGFTDLGAMRRDNLCHVVDYIESVFKFGLLPAGAIRIHVAKSNITSAGMPFYTLGGLHATVEGFVEQYVKTTTDPAPFGHHGEISMYFKYPIPVNSNYSVTSGECTLDLAFMELHNLAHAMGFFSFLETTGTVKGTGSFVSSLSGSPFSRLDRSMHSCPDPTTSSNPLGSLTPLIDPTTFAFNPPSLPSTRQIWINGLQAPENHGINFSPDDWDDDQLHISDYRNYLDQNRISPGDYQEYVMGPSFGWGGVYRRKFTKGEIETFINILGYSYNSTYSSAHPISNHTPYSNKMNSDAYNHIYLENGAPSVWTADYTITNNTGTSLTIDLTADATLIDPDGDPITVLDGSLVNLRGCGSGGNNHAQLSLNAAKNKITYTPRANFYGRAQFGFNLYDGKEAGGFVIYTIDVQKGTAVSISPGSNLVLNGSYEEGSEVKTIGTIASESINNSTTVDGNTHGARMCRTAQLSDSHPFSEMKDISLDGSLIVNQSNGNSDCIYVADKGFGYAFGTFPAHWLLPNVVLPNPPIITEARYQSTSKQKVLFLLGDNMQECKHYQLSFNARRTVQTPGAYPSPDTVEFGFTDDAHLDYSSWSTWGGSVSSVGLLYSPTASASVSKAISATSWENIKIGFNYCSSTTSNVLSLNVLAGSGSTAPHGMLLLDNVSIKEVPFTVTASVEQVGSCLRKLVANADELATLGCNPTVYTWRVLGSPTVISTSKEFTVEPLLPITYEVTADDGCGNIATDQVTVTPCRCSPYFVMGTSSFSVINSTTAIPSPLPSGTYLIAEDITIPSNNTFATSNILINPDVKITVAPSAKLTINNSHLFVCPDTNKLWKGITLSSGGNVELNNNTLIEDAETAITATSPALASGSSYIIKTQDAVFNRNRQGIAISNYTPTSPSVYPFQIANTVFTSRDLSTFSGYPTTWASTAALGATFSNTAATAPYVLCRDYSPLMLKNGIEPLAGIKLSDVGTLSGASYPYIQIGMVTTPNDANLFDNVGDGINALNSNFTVHNAAFANNKPAPLGSRTIGLAYAVGTGIYADKGYQRRADISYAAAVNYDLYVKFYDCASGIKLNSYSISNIYRNNVYSSNTDPNAKIRGIDVTLSRYDSCIVSGNFLYNIPTSIYLYSSTASGGYRLGRSRISNNTIQPELPSPVSTTGTESVLQGIDVSAALFSSSGVVTDKVQVTGNTLNRVYNGIKVSNYNMQKVLTMTNSITMKYQSAAAVQYGVYANNNYDALVYGNTVSGIGTVTNDPRKRAFYSASNRILAIQCNSSSHTGIGFDFSGIQPQSFWWHNTMLDHVNGMAIGGPIDQQGNGTQATLNEWNGSWLGTNYQTLCYGSTDPSLSPMYVKNNSLQNPSNNSSYPPGPTIPKYPDAGSIVTTTYAVYDPCAPSTSFEPRAIGGLLPHLIKAGNVDYGTDNDVNAWLGQMSLWRIIHSDDSFNYFSNNDFVDFAAMADTARFGWLTSIEDALGEGDTNTAQSLLASPVAAKGYVYVSQNLMLTDVSAADYIVDNYTQFYTLYLDYLKGEAVDSSLLASLCFKCPRLEGDVVHQARSFYTQLYGATEVYNDDSLCAIGNTQRVLPDPSIDIAGSDAVTANYTLFPNPNSGNFVIKQKYAQNKRVYLKVYNAIGALVYQGEAVFSNGQASVVIGDKAAGVYLVCFGDEKDKTICLRFTVK